jgi:hypothetical protein
MKRLLAFTISLLVLNFAVAGCCSVIAKSGDAKILKCPQIFIHDPGTELFLAELPTVSLAQTGIHIFRVRVMPAYLVGEFRFGLRMLVPYGEDILYEKNPTWGDAKITVAFRKLDGSEIFRQSFVLGASPHGFSQAHDGWEVGWNLGAGPDNMDPVPVTDQSFDIVVDVEQPSRRPSDQIDLTGFAFVHKS